MAHDEDQGGCSAREKALGIDWMVCEWNVLSEFRVHSALSFPKSEASVLIDLMTKSVMQLVVAPPATVGLGLCFQLPFRMSFSTLPSLRFS